MNYWGYGKKTFGLLKDDGRVKITHIKAKHPVSEYPNNGGGYKARDEIKAYFDENIDAAPDSKHYLVFMPKPETEPEGGLPYYGLGKWGFVIDVGQSAEKAPNSGGGAAHELGHALGLPHNAHPKSRKLEIGTALMNNGNNVWNHRGGSKTTSLTEATTEILNNNQVFSKEKSDFYSSIDATLTDTSGTYKNGDIIVDGKFQSNVPVTKAVVILNPEGRASYNQIGFVSTIERNRFQVEISKKELFEADNANYGLKVWLVFENGQRKKYDLPSFSFKDGKPDISFP